MGFFDKWKARKAEEERKAQEWQKTLREMEVERKVENLGSEEPGHADRATKVTFADDWLNRLRDQVEREQEEEPVNDSDLEPSASESIINQGSSGHRLVKEEKLENTEQILQRPALGDRFNTMFSSIVGKVFANQQMFAKKVAGDKDWFVDLEKGIIDFEGRQFPVQLLGSESRELNDWLWIWANDSPLPDLIKEAALQCRQYGEKHGLEPLTTAQLPITDHMNGHMLTILSASIYQENVCYYKAPYKGGAAFVLVRELPDEIFAQVDALTFANLCTQVVSAYAVDHKRMVEGFLRDNGCKVEWKTDNKRIAASFEDGDELLIEFDIYGRIKSMNAEQ